MPNVLVEFTGVGGFVSHVECINTDRLNKTNDFPDEAIFAGHIEGAIERDDKHCFMTPDRYRSYLYGKFRNKVVLDVPYTVEEHIVITVKL